MNIGERIKKIRKQKKLTLVELGEKIGLKKSTISRYEKNDINIPSDKLEKIAHALNVSPQYLLGFEEVQNDIDTSMLSDSQLKELDLILSTNNIMFFKGNKSSKESYEMLKNSITKVYINMLKDNNEL
ncbi:helix-turn-helix transcriptional regulator [Sneathia vaginalis]|uniref:helix-turn-helix domain-containing protein n=1 Tax=Sneathia TaxID=168808 RepID=UPI000695E746|nr:MULTISPECIES: helix-turn-helix transcriptional regulator [Sneathia]MBE2989782.1 helix-turn-helix transcriptional regulator [Sneathia sp. DSM 16630]MBE3030627.1 helix-turn-helix transcriptional regulator [Sneathia sp. DSM 16631]MDK9582467.1 helix-turn-helix transcriptional regulator [Sneathia vaginalis]